MSAKVRCPTCRREVAWDENSPWRPFCSERCRLIDLGEWAQERFRVPLEEATAWDEEGEGPRPLN